MRALNTLACIGLILIQFAVLYGFGCLICILFPANGSSPFPEVRLRKPWRYVLFLPLALGKLEYYMLHAIFIQIGVFVFLAGEITLLILQICGVQIPESLERLPEWIVLGIAVLGIVISIVKAVRNRR